MEGNSGAEYFFRSWDSNSSELVHSCMRAGHDSGRVSTPVNHKGQSAYHLIWSSAHSTIANLNTDVQIVEDPTV